MNLGIIMVTVALLIGVKTTTDISTKNNQLVPGYEIKEEELNELRESMEPELFEGVIYYYEVQNEPIENTVVDTNIEPLKNLYVQKGMNIRNKPGIHGKVLGTLTMGDSVKVYLEKEEWTYVVSEKGEGYVTTKYLGDKKPEPQKKKGVPVSSANSSVPKAGESVVGNETYETEMTFNLSFYSNLPEHNGGYSKSASGKTLAYGMAANNKLPIGTKIYLEGWGVFTIEDRGGSHFNSINRVDIFIPPKSGESKKEYIARLRTLGRKSVRGTILN